MRPRKQVLLLMPEYEASLWRLRLDIAGYAVLCAASFDEASALLWHHDGCRLVVCDAAMQASVKDLQPEGAVKVLLIGGTVEQSIATEADCFEVEGPALPARVMQRVKIMLARKRGPKKIDLIHSEAMALKCESSLRRRAARRLVAVEQEAVAA